MMLDSYSQLMRSSPGFVAAQLVLTTNGGPRRNAVAALE
jgi:hypothetical protein